MNLARRAGSRLGSISYAFTPSDLTKGKTISEVIGDRIVFTDNSVLEHIGDFRWAFYDGTAFEIELFKVAKNNDSGDFIYTNTKSAAQLAAQYMRLENCERGSSWTPIYTVYEPFRKTRIKTTMYELSQLCILDIDVPDLMYMAHKGIAKAKGQI